MDIYLKYRGFKSCNQGLDVLSGFHFLIIEGLQIIEGKSSNHIIFESIETNTSACGICWLKWRVAQGVMNFIEYCMNVNTLIIDVVETLEKSNSNTSWNWTYIFCDRLTLNKHAHKVTHVFILLEVFSNFMNPGELFRLDVSIGFVEFWVIC